MVLTPRLIDATVGAALEEDAPQGDLTSLVLIPQSAQATATLVAREPGVFSGGAVFAAAMRLVDPDVRVDMLIEDGGRLDSGMVIAQLTGLARSVLASERVALNFVQRMSGIATLTSKFVAEVAGTTARIVDTRKTTPGLRAFERHAVRSGGGHNHRWGLSDAVMVKDNHLAVLEQGGLSITDALLRARQQMPHTTHLEVEVDRVDQIEAVLAAGVDTIMFDNFSLDALRTGVALVAGRAIVEASGNVNLSTVRVIAQTGVDIISSGALTHSAPALDLGLDVTVQGST